MATYPQDGMVTANGVQLHYQDWEGPAEGAGTTPLLLLHGLASAARIWDLVAPLLAQDRRVIALDQRGHGRSAKPDGGYDFATIVADDVAAAAALGLGDHYAVAGHSWGAHVALEMAAAHPERVAALALVDGGLPFMQERPDATWETIRRDLAPPDYAGTPRATYLGWMHASIPQWRPELDDIVLNIVELRADDTVGPRLAFPQHMAILRAMWDERLDAVYAAIHCSTFFILAEGRDGQDDALSMKRRVFVAAQQQLTAAPTVAVAWLADTVHDVPLQRPDVLAAQVAAFLRQTLD